MMPTKISKSALAAIAISISLLTFLFLRPTSVSVAAGSGYHTYVPHVNSGTHAPPSQPAPKDSIPNIVHYTFLKRDANSALKLSFQDYLSVYGATVYFKPDAIYLHTDHNDTYLEEVARDGNRWTRAILTQFPTLKINHVVVPTKMNGIDIVNIEAKSDFVRWEAMLQFGGIYLDWDVLPLRDITHFRRMGFRNVVGRQSGGKVNSGLAMCEVNSTLAYLMARDGPRVFTGEWERHAVTLVTDISQRLVAIEGEVLILDMAAWAPTTWLADSFDKLFAPHNDWTFSDDDIRLDQEQDPMARWDSMPKLEGWQFDFSSTYLLHAFKSRGHPVEGWYAEWKGITVKYIMDRNSNFARAAYPLVKRMIDEGLVDANNEEL